MLVAPVADASPDAPAGGVAAALPAAAAFAAAEPAIGPRAPVRRVAASRTATMSVSLSVLAMKGLSPDGDGGLLGVYRACSAAQYESSKRWIRGWSRSSACLAVARPSRTSSSAC